MSSPLTSSIIIQDGVRTSKYHDKVNRDKTLRIMASYIEAVHLGVRVPNEINVWLAKSFFRYIYERMSLQAALLMTPNREDKKNNVRPNPPDTHASLRIEQIPAAMDQIPDDTNDLTKAAANYILHAEIVARHGIEPDKWDSQGKACYLMRAFIKAVELGWPVPQNIELWIAIACHQIFIGEVLPNDAFMVKKPKKGKGKRPKELERKQRQIVLSILAKQHGSVSSAAEYLNTTSNSLDFITKELKHVCGALEVESLKDDYYRKPILVPNNELERKYELINTLTNWIEMEPE